MSTNTKKLEKAISRALGGVADESYDLARAAMEDLVRTFGLEVEISEDSDVIVNDDGIVPFRKVIVKIKQDGKAN